MTLHQPTAWCQPRTPWSRLVNRSSQPLSGRGSRAGALPGTPRGIRGPVRPATQPDLQAQARRHHPRAVQGDRRVHRVHPRQGLGLGSRPGQRVPAGRGDAAGPQGGPAAACRRSRGRGRPGAAGGARPAVRPTAAVPRVQAGCEGTGRALRARLTAASAVGTAGARVQRATTRDPDQPFARTVRRPRGTRDDAASAADRIDRTHPSGPGLDPRAGRT